VAAEILCSGDAFRSGQHYRLRPCPRAVPVCDESVPDIASDAMTSRLAIAVSRPPAMRRRAFAETVRSPRRVGVTPGLTVAASKPWLIRSDSSSSRSQPMLRSPSRPFRRYSRAAAYPAALQGTNSRGLVSTGSLAEAVKSTEAI
jgi:hypothetical protein